MLHESELSKLFYARALVRSGEVDRARALLTALDTREFDEANRLDEALAWSMVAAVSLRSDDLQMARERLKASTASQPFFEVYRQQALVTLLETTPKKVNRKVGELLRKLNEYVSLKPNAFGIGIDLNKILEDISAKPDKGPV